MVAVTLLTDNVLADVCLISSMTFYFVGLKNIDTLIEHFTVRICYRQKTAVYDNPALLKTIDLVDRYDITSMHPNEFILWQPDFGFLHRSVNRVQFPGSMQPDIVAHCFCV